MKYIHNFFRISIVITLCFLTTSYNVVYYTEGEGNSKTHPAQKDHDRLTKEFSASFIEFYKQVSLTVNTSLNNSHSFITGLFIELELNKIKDSVITKVLNNKYYQKATGTYIPYSEYDYIIKRYSKDSPIMLHADIMARTITEISKKKTKQEADNHKSLISDLSQAMYCISLTSKQSNLDLKYIKKHSLNTASKSIRYRNFMEDHEGSLKHQLGRKYNCKANNGRYIETSPM
ncbi:hypothetical protein [Vibrio barjaei]|uniref:hypothetical protein n=1 Tax=Vibrio barjaei TaxID=1676683 RepID=UPI0022846B89|nr:hypothetical protein [Vibrio barjaei]MCY9872338.1 hypothetical protein [Vibrio barjaei]